jgi:hypothetical protein
MESVGLKGLQNKEEYTSIRVNFTNLARTLVLSKLNSNNIYETFYTYTGDFGITNSSSLQIGFSQASPIETGKSKSVLVLKDIHSQGILTDKRYRNDIILISPPAYYLNIADGSKFGGNVRK